jgi:hypothetical protein
MATTVLNNKSIMNAGTFSHTSLSDYTLSVNANQTIGVVGTLGETVDGAVTETYGNTLNSNVTGAVTETYSSTQNTTASGNITIVAPTIDLNP